MTNIIVPSDTPCVIPDFDPVEDMLVIALPESKAPGPGGVDLDHALSIRYIPRANLTEVELTLAEERARFIIRLPKVRQLPPGNIAVLSLEDARRLTVKPKLHTTATLTGHGLYPPETGNGFGAGGQPRKFAYTYKHDWAADGPPSERFFDLSNPRSELSLRIGDVAAGSVYAIQFIENAGTGEAIDTYRSILICQTAPGVPRLKPAKLTQWFATHLGSDRFRVIAWIYLGNEGSYRDPETGKLHRFGHINDSPRLALQGPIAGSVAITR